MKCHPESRKPFFKKTWICRKTCMLFRQILIVLIVLYFLEPIKLQQEHRALYQLSLVLALYLLQYQPLEYLFKNMLTEEKFRS